MDNMRATVATCKGRHTLYLWFEFAALLVEATCRSFSSGFVLFSIVCRVGWVVHLRIIWSLFFFGYSQLHIYCSLLIAVHINKNDADADVSHDSTIGSEFLM